MNDLKSELYEFCRDHVSSRLSRIQDQMRSLQESLDTETKSSAGDKYETGRAMLQLEREKLGQQLLEVEKVAEVLKKVSLTKRSANVGLGSLVRTTTNDYFISISAGEFIKNDIRIYCISPQTPVGKLVFGKVKGDILTFNHMTFRIIDII